MFILDELNGTHPSEPDPSYAQFRDQTRFWIQRVAVPMLMVIGLFGNLVTIIIMTRRRMRSTTNLYLAALAFVDMLYLVLTFLLGLSHYPNMASHKYYIYWKLRPFLMMLTDACSNTSVWLTVTFTIERYIAVKYPMKGKVWCTETRAKKLIIAVFAVGVLFASPVPFEWIVVEKRSPATDTIIRDLQQPPTSARDSGLTPALNDVLRASNGELSGGYSRSSNESTIANHTMDEVHERRAAAEAGKAAVILALDYSDFGRNETYKTIYYWSTAVIFYFIPLFSLMLFNGFLIKSVHQSQRERTKMTGCQSVKQQSPASTAHQTAAAQTMPSRGSHVNGLVLNGASKGNYSSQENSKNRDYVAQRSSLDSQREFVPRNELGAVASSDDTSQAEVARLKLLGLSHAGSIDISSHHHHHQAITRADITGRDCLRSKYVQENCDTQSKSGADGVRVTDKSANDKTGANPNTETRPESPAKLMSSVPSKSIFFNKSITIASINQSSIHSQPHTIPASSQERRITIMLISVVILFLICQIPSAAMLLYTSVHESPPNTNEHALVLAFGNIFNFLMAVNAAGNFILYSFLSKKYRKTFVILFCSCFGSRRAEQEHHHHHHHHQQHQQHPPSTQRTKTINARYEKPSVLQSYSPRICTTVTTSEISHGQSEEVNLV